MGIEAGLPLFSSCASLLHLDHPLPPLHAAITTAAIATATATATPPTDHLPPPFLEYLAKSGIDPSIYSAARFLPRYIRIKSGFEGDVCNVETELSCKLRLLPWLKGFYSLPQEVNISSSKAYQLGKIFGMDAASGAAVYALGIQKGDHVLDLCAAPGAKLCMMAEILGWSGTLTGVDIAKHRLAACRTMLLKYGLGNHSRLFVADGTQFTLLPLHQSIAKNDTSFTKEGSIAVYSRWKSPKTRKEKKAARSGNAAGTPQLLFYGEDSGVIGLSKEQILENCCRNEKEGSVYGYDKVLIDAECTHDGSLKHIFKYEQWGWDTLERRLLDIDRLNSITKLQLQLLTNGFRLLKSGGVLVYSTCSFTLAQNEQVVETFLADHANAELVEIEDAKLYKWPCRNGRLAYTLRFDPLCSSTSGLFIAKIRKHGNNR